MMAFLSSYKLACLVLLWLFVLTLTGTLEHGYTELSLYEAQKKYFDSFFFEGLYVPLGLIHPALGEPRIGMPLPGGQLALCVLFVNLLVGGLIRIRKGKATLGILIAHVGILLMLVAGFVKYYVADDGQMTVFEGERSQEFESYYAWQITITRQLDDGRIRECVIPSEQFDDMQPGETRTFKRDDLPFDLVLSHYMPHCDPQPKGPNFEVPVPVVDGFYLRSMPLELDAEHNVAGVYATLVEKDGGEEHRAILWGTTYNRIKATSTAARNPHVVDIDGVPWGVELMHERYVLPYALHLEDFTHEVHPRTDMPSNFQSDLLRLEGERSERVVIRMNEPYRDTGHVLFQHKYGPPDARPGERMFSVFVVSRNPSDHWPLVSCVIILVGLVMHFSRKLTKYVQKEARSAS